MSGLSKEFSTRHKKKFIIVNRDGTFEKNTLNPNELYGGPTYVFTTVNKIPKKITERLDEIDLNMFPKGIENNGSMLTCLDQHYTSPDINTILDIFPRMNIVHPLFNTDIVIKTNIKKLQLDNLEEQICDILNQVLKNKIKAVSSNLTVELWLENFIANPFWNAYDTIVKYPKEITDSSLSKLIKIKPTDIFVRYDARASTYEKEMELFQSIGEAFEKPSSYVTIYDTYNGLLKKITKELDDNGLKYDKVNDYAIRTQYKNIKEITLRVDLSDFI